MVKPSDISEIIVCYTDSNTQQTGFDVLSARKYIDNMNNFDTDAYVADHMNRIVHSVYNTNNNIIKQHIDEQDNFFDYCENYGLTSDDYRRTIVDPNTNTTYVIMGIRQNNTKYKILLQCVDTNTRIKATASYVRYLIRTADDKVTV
jgi:hypothetical protein